MSTRIIDHVNTRGHSFLNTSKSFQLNLGQLVHQPTSATGKCALEPSISANLVRVFAFALVHCGTWGKGRNERHDSSSSTRGSQSIRELGLLLNYGNEIIASPYMSSPPTSKSFIGKLPKFCET